SRFFADCSGVEPYLRPICSTMFSPSGGICGFSSNGWKRTCASIPSPFSLSSAAVSPPSPTTHHGQTMSEMKSMCRVRAMGRSPEIGCPAYRVSSRPRRLFQTLTRRHPPAARRANRGTGGGVSSPLPLEGEGVGGWGGGRLRPCVAREAPASSSSDIAPPRAHPHPNPPPLRGRASGLRTPDPDHPETSHL